MAWVEFKAWLRNTTTECIRKGHDECVIVSNRLLHQKGGRQPMVNVFDGTHKYCRREGCKWNKTAAVFVGSISVADMEALLKEKKGERF